MAVSKKAPAVPVNFMDTLNSLNNAATSPVQKTVTEQIPVSQNYAEPAQIPVQKTVQEQPKPAVQAESVKAEAKPANPTEKTMISLRLLKNDKEKFQEFFKSCGLSFTDGLYMAADFIEKEVENGRLQMSKSGIQYK